MNMTEKPLLIYDGTCGFCKRWVTRFHAVTKSGFTYAPYQEAACRYPNVPAEEFSRAAQCFEADGTRHSGADAMLFALSTGTGPQWPYKIYQRYSFIRSVTDAVYGIIARNRSLASAIDRFLWGKEPVPEPPAISVTQWILGPLTGVAFCTYGATFIPRWDALYGWNYWSILACFWGGGLLALAYGLKLRYWIRMLACLLMLAAAADPVSALAIFGFTRPTLPWQLWGSMIVPVTFLMLFFLTPLAQKIYRKCAG